MKVRSHQCQVAPTRVQTSTPPFDMTFIPLYTHSNSYPVWTSPYCQSQMCGIRRIRQEASIFQTPDRKVKSKFLWNTRSFQKNITVSENYLILKEIGGCSSNTSLIINKQPIHIHNHRQRWCQQYFNDFSMGIVSVYPQPVSITWSNRPWRQFTISYSAVCCSLEQTKNTNNTHEIQDGDKRSTVGVNTKTKADCFS